MSLQALTDARVTRMTGADEARYRLALAIYDADQTHRAGGKLSRQRLQDLITCASEVLELQARGSPAQPPDTDTRDEQKGIPK